MNDLFILALIFLAITVCILSLLLLNYQANIDRVVQNNFDKLKKEFERENGYDFFDWSFTIRRLSRKSREHEEDLRELNSLSLIREAKMMERRKVK